MLQIAFTPFDSYSAVELAAGFMATVASLLGLFIGYLAFRALRRHGGKQMRYLSLGMVILFGVTYAVAIVGQSLISIRVLPLLYQNLFRLLVRTLQVVGLTFITYSLWSSARSGPSSESTESAD